MKTFLLRDKMGMEQVQTAEIITFNTIRLKGAIRDVGRALKMPLDEVAEIYNQCEDNVVPQELRETYPELFYSVDLVDGTVVSVGTHPSGVLVSDLDIAKSVGLCSISSSDYPVSMLNMKELDYLMLTKLDILGLDGVGVINDTCKMLGIERLTPDNTDLNDEAVWNSIREDTTLIFQWESKSAQQFLKKFLSPKTIAIAKQKNPNFSMLEWLSFGNGLIRPACASFRDAVAAGEFYDNGFEELNQFLAQEAGRIAMQETIMQFLVKFCGYSNAESDTVRRAIAKKKGTETLLGEIEQRFIACSSTHYDITEERCKEVIKPFLQVILDASAYAFSWNHSDAYSAIGYICGYLRYYHPYEFLTAALNVFTSDQDKTAEITEYAKRQGIHVTMPKWGISTDQYAFDKEKHTISKNLTSIKFISKSLAIELFQLSKAKTYPSFVSVLFTLFRGICINTRQLDVLLKLDFFSEFGNQRELACVANYFLTTFKKGEAKKIKRELVDGTELEGVVKRFSVGCTKSGEINECYCAGTKRDQSKIVFNECRNMLTGGPLRMRFQVNRESISHQKSGSFLKALSKEDGRKGDGTNPALLVLDKVKFVQGKLGCIGEP